MQTEHITFRFFKTGKEFLKIVQATQTSGFIIAPSTPCNTTLFPCVSISHFPSTCKVGKGFTPCAINMIATHCMTTTVISRFIFSFLNIKFRKFNILYFFCQEYREAGASIRSLENSAADLSPKPYTLNSVCLQSSVTSHSVIVHAITLPLSSFHS